MLLKSNILNKNINNNNKNNIKNNNKTENNKQINLNIYESIANYNLNGIEIDIVKYMLKISKDYEIKDNYFKKQTEITNNMRYILVDWMVDVNLKFKMKLETYFKAVNIIDFYLSKVDIKKSEFQLLGTTAMFIAAKMEEIYPPGLEDFTKICDGAYLKSDLLKMEKNILHSFKFNLNFPTALSFYNIYKDIVDLDTNSYYYGLYLLELFMMDQAAITYNSSDIALAIIFLVCKIYKNKKIEAFEKNFDTSIKLISQSIYFKSLELSANTKRAVYRKYASDKYNQIAFFKIEKFNN